MTITPFMDVETFRILRPALKDPQRYPNALIQHYLTLACNNFNIHRWGAYLNEGICDWTAHYVVIQVRNAQAAERGGVSGNAIGRVESKSVGGVSVSYDVNATEEDAGHWDTTTYGSAFMRLVRIVGAGGAQLGGYFLGPPFNGPAWPGPWMSNLPVNSI